MRTRTKIVLLVEDDEAHAELIGLSFEPRHDVELAVASTLGEARRRLADGVPDLLILDSLLPDGRGVDFLTGLPREAPYPIILLTSHADETVQSKALAAGATRYVVKSEVTLLEMPEIADRVWRETGGDG